MPIRVRQLPFLLLLAFAAPAAAFVDSYQWCHPLPQGNSVNGFVFRDAATGWAACGGGSLLRTLDGGASWQLQHGPDGAAGDFADVVLSPSGALVVAGDTGVRRSTDDGATLDQVPLPSAAELRDACLIPGGGLSAAGAGGTVLVSWDDGLTWTDVGPGTGEVRHHLWRSATEGYVVGDGLAHRTTDGGATWTQLFPPNFLGMNEVYFTADGTGVILEDFARWISTDGGATWTKINAGAAPLYRFRTVEASPGHLFTVAFLEGCELWESTDGGITWTQLQLHGTVGFPSLALTPGGRLLWGSDAGDLFWSDDDGVTIHDAAANLTPGAPSAPIDAF
ncbi:MAG TPA: hypothetical protein P5571_14075, partial [Candidatus Krumholzibacteria bacterium]|nr:hypothetical protein [Candidatus Krumholzibacteria bacterium]